MSLDFTLATEHGSFNITHNLGKMAREAHLYDVLWRAEESGYYEASQIIEKLEDGIDRLEKYPTHFKKFEAENGWGTYDGLLGFCKEVLACCKENPNATINVSR